MEENTSLSRLDVGIHIDEETVKSNETDLGISEKQFISKMCEGLDEDDVEADSLNRQTEDGDMTEMSSLISDIKRRIEELRNSLDVDETDSDSQNDLTESEAEDEWFQVVGNSSPMDSESHDIETAVTSYTNGQNSRHPIETTEVFSESFQTSNNNETFESNKTVPDISAELSKGLMFGLDLYKEGLFKSDNSRNDGNNENLRNHLRFKTFRILTNRKGK